MAAVKLLIDVKVSPPGGIISSLMSIRDEVVRVMLSGWGDAMRNSRSSLISYRDTQHRESMNRGGGGRGGCTVILNCVEMLVWLITGDMTPHQPASLKTVLSIRFGSHHPLPLWCPPCMSQQAGTESHPSSSKGQEAQCITDQPAHLC